MNKHVSCCEEEHLTVYSRVAAVAYWIKHWTMDQKIQGSSRTSSRDLFLFWVHSALPQKLSRFSFASFGGDVKPSVLGNPLKISPQRRTLAWLYINRRWCLCTLVLCISGLLTKCPIAIKVHDHIHTSKRKYLFPLPLFMHNSYMISVCCVLGRTWSRSYLRWQTTWSNSTLPTGTWRNCGVRMRP